MLRSILLLSIACPLGLLLSPAWSGLPLLRRGRVIGLVSLAIGGVALGTLTVMHGRTLEPGAALADALVLPAYTRVGRIYHAQGAAMLLASALLSSETFSRAAVVPLVLALACTALGGHAIVAGVDTDLSVAALVHVLVAGAWLGGLPVLWLLARRRRHLESWRSALIRFSCLALPAMLLVIASGLWLADWTVARGAALVATPYGQVLLLKLLGVMGVLVCAVRLRRWLTQGGSPVVARRWLAAEGLLALFVASAAGTMAGLVPAAHDAIRWPFPFRFDPDVAWRLGGQDVRARVAAAATLLAAGALAAWAWRRQSIRAVLAGAGCVAASVALALPAVSVEAYPTTYAAAEAVYDAASVTDGARLYEKHCVDCHGARGHGDGPKAAGMQPPPADLTAPHLGWHTHGDLYWWLLQGYPRSAMPGFSDRTTSVERWHLINHLTALSLGHEARGLTDRIAAREPWLAAIDFRYRQADGRHVSLSEWRRRAAVLLVFAREADALPRVEALAAHLPAQGARVVAVMPPDLHALAVKNLHARRSDSAQAPPAAAFDLVADIDGSVTEAWMHYRRTLANPDFDNRDPLPARIEFLIDRFGFVRARWRSDETPAAASAPALAAALQALAAEPELKVPDVHAH